MSKRQNLLFLFTILLAGFVLRIAHLNDPITYDEAYTWEAFASQPLFTVISDYHLPNNHVFHSLLVHFSGALFGNHLWSLRIPALLAGMGIIWLTYQVGKRLYLPEVGLLAATFVAFSPEEIFYASRARGYSLLAFFTLSLFLLSMAALREKRFSIWGGIALISALGFWTIPLMVFPFGIAFLWLFLSAIFGDFSKHYDGRIIFLKYWLGSGIAAVFLTLCFYLPVLYISGYSRLVVRHW